MGFYVRHFVHTITSKKQANCECTKHNTRETINHDGRPTAVYGHDNLRKALPDGVNLALLRKPCFRSIVKGGEGQESNGTVTEIVTFQANLGQRRGDDAAQE